MSEIIKKAPVLSNERLSELTVSDLDLKPNFGPVSLIRLGALAQRDTDYRYYLKEFVKWLRSHLMGHECENLQGQKVRYRVLMEGDWQTLLEQVEKSKIPDVMNAEELHQYIKEKMPAWITEVHRLKEIGK